MDFEIGNLFYIVITVVAIIIGLLGKKKKPADQGTGETEGKTQPGFLENLERAFNMGQENEVVDLRDYEEDIPVEEEVIAPTQGPMTETGGLLEEYERMKGRKNDIAEGGIILSEADIITEPLEVIQLREEEGTDFFEVIKDFDAGTAVVYSAIINRVDY